MLTPKSTLESAEYAASQLRDAIVAGKLQPGERLVEMNLATQLGISRHPIREALRRLSREGLVEIRPNRGAIVAQVDGQSILEVYEIRTVIGSLALRHLLSAGLPPAAKTLRELDRTARQVVALAAKGDQPEMVRCDLEFQAMIVDASGLARAASYFRSLGAEIERFINLLHVRFPDPKAVAERELLGLCEAIRAGDLDRADAIWRQKLTVAARRLIGIVGAKHQADDPRWRIFSGNAEP